jgi:polyhydroxyalkanoate synthesis regulator phasin
MATRSSGSRSTRGRSGAKRTTSQRRKTTTGRRSAASARTDKSVEAFRKSLERSVTLPRDRVQEIVDDAVKRGRMTRGDANDLVSKLVSRGRKQRDDLLRDLEKLLDSARKEVESRTAGTRRQAGRATGRAARRVRDAADRPLAEADRLRRRAGVARSSPITAYDQLTVAQIRTRLRDLAPAELRKVRTQEQRSKARKGILDEIERRLTKG